MTMVGSAWDVQTSTEAPGVTAGRPEWFDDLVTLHVLTTHGDTAAADDVARWAAADPVVAQLSTRLRELHRTSTGA